VLGVLVAAAWRLRATAMLAAALVVAEAAMSHPFWAMGGGVRGTHLLQFVKDAGLAGGFLLLALTSTAARRRWGDGRRGRRGRPARGRGPARRGGGRGAAVPQAGAGFGPGLSGRGTGDRTVRVRLVRPSAGDPAFRRTGRGDVPVRGRAG